MDTFGRSVTEEHPRTLSSRLQEFSGSLHSGISRWFRWHGACVSQRPWTVIFSSLLLCGICMSLYYTLLEEELDGKRLFTPNTAQSFDDMDTYESYYGTPPSQTRVLISRKVDLAKEPECRHRGLLVETERARSYLLKIFEIFDEIEALEINYQGSRFRLEDICERTRPDGPCKVMSVLAAWNHSRQALIADPNPIETLAALGGSDETNQDVGYLLGIQQEGDVCPGNVEVIQGWIILRYEPESVHGVIYDPKNREWNRALVRLLWEDWEDDDLTVYVSNLDAVDMESNRSLEKDERLLWASYAMVLIYCHVALFKNSWTHCKSHLAIISCISVIMAIYSSYGICQLFGIKFNPVNKVLPFLLMGLGVDDTFVILSAYSETDVSMSVVDRLQQTSMRAGSAILITSITDFVAFLSGTFTTLLALRNFSIYAAMGILFDFFYQITFFLAFLALDARREHRRYETLIGEDTQPLNMQSCGSGLSFIRSSEDLDLPMLNGRVDKNDLEAVDDEEDYLTLNGLSEKSRIPDKKLIGSGNYTSKPSFTSMYLPTPSLSVWSVCLCSLVGKWMPRVTLRPLGKIGVLMVELGLLVFSIYGCTRVKMDFRYEEWFIPDDSYLHKALDIQNDYFLGDQIPFYAVTQETAPNAHFYSQEALLGFAQALRDDPYVAETPPIRFWYDDFIAYSAQMQPASVFQNASFLDPHAFYGALHQFLQGPGAVYAEDVLFDASGERLQAARVSAFTTGIGSGHSAVRTVDSIRHTVESSARDLDPLAYSYGFLYYDGFRVIAWETTRNVMLAATAVFLVTLAILANLRASLAVLLMVALTDIMLFGLMWYSDLTFNSVTCICMVLAVGIAVDYSVHIAHAFLSVDGTRDARAEEALYRIGGAVLNGAFTTALAIFVLVFAEHYIFQTFFRMFFSIVVCGVWHGLVVLPVVLSFIGPAPYRIPNLQD